VRRVWLTLSVIVTGLAIVFIISVLARPVLPSINLKPNFAKTPSERKARKAQADLQRALAKTQYVVPAKRRAHVPIVAAPTVPAPVIPTTRPLSVGFFINWDESSYESLKRNLDHLDWVVAEWSRLQSVPDGQDPLATDVHIPALNWIRLNRPQTRILPLVQNQVDGNWNGELLARSIGGEPHRRRRLELQSGASAGVYCGGCFCSGSVIAR
jgi:hypothetical protein